MPLFNRLYGFTVEPQSSPLNYNVGTIVHFRIAEQQLVIFSWSLLPRVYDTFKVLKRTNNHQYIAF